MNPDDESTTLKTSSEDARERKALPLPPNTQALAEQQQQQQQQQQNKKKKNRGDRKAQHRRRRLRRQEQKTNKNENNLTDQNSVPMDHHNPEREPAESEQQVQV